MRKYFYQSGHLAQDRYKHQ